MTRAVLRVLVADDNAVIADTLAQALKLQGFDAVAVDSGEAAVVAASTFHPDVAILDVVLSGINGIDAALAILKVQPTCRIILFSGNHETAAILEKALADGHSFEIFAKPVHLLELLEALGPLLPQIA